MAKQEHLDVLKQGVERWNRWREQHPGIQPDLSDAYLRHTRLRGANLQGADLSGADLNYVILIGAMLNDTLLGHADLNGAHLNGTHLNGSDLNSAHLSDAHLVGAKLRHADLNGAHLNNADLRNAHMDSIDLSSARLNRADLRNAHLRHACLRSADLGHADLGDADLRDADLRDADLREALFRFGRLDGVNLRGAVVSRTLFADLDLRTVKGLAELRHDGPSSIELYTVQLPQDGSALHFLRGCGVPDEWIDDYRAHTMSPIQYHSCFISYSSKDDALARRLHADLQARGVRCWFSPEDMKIGDKIRSRIDQAIHLQDKLLLLLSEHALLSDWVEDEVEAAMEKEHQQQREVLFPVRLDESVMQTTQAWAAKLRRTRHIGDFTCWTDPQAYEQAFARLLRDLKTRTHGENNG